MKKQRKDNSLLPDNGTNSGTNNANNNGNNSHSSRKGWWGIAFLMCVAVIIILYPYFSGYETKEDLATDPISYVAPTDPNTTYGNGIFVGTYPADESAELAA